jgi:phosphate transport system substrate-binding protein
LTENVRTRAGIAALAMLFIAAACASPAASPSPATGTQPPSNALSGSIRIDGSSTVAPLSEVAADLYMTATPSVNVSVATSGTSGGFQKFCSGETDMNDASREIKESEIEQCGDNDIAFDNIQVANDALSLVVNRENPIDCMTVAQASQIWDLESPVATWGDVEGLDIPAEFASQTMTLYGPGTDSGTFDFFTEAINGEEGRIRINYTDIGEDDQAAVVGVEGDLGAMGFIPYSFVQESLDAVKPLAIDDGSGTCVEATLENVQDGSYQPLGRPLFVYAGDLALQRPEVQDFLRFYVDNSSQIADQAGYVPMTDEQLAEQNAKIDQLVGGG